MLFVNFLCGKIFYQKKNQLIIILQKNMQGKQTKKPEKTQATSNAQNIQSKLLGASVSEINIEKLRTLSTGPTWYNLNGRLHQQILKTITSKFSLDLIFCLDISGQNLANIDVIAECKHLTMLNMSNNQIKDLFPLQKLEDLMFLSISQNSIHSLDYLGGLKQLTNLQAQQNNLKSVKSVQTLQQCLALKTLAFQNLSGKLANPLCDLEDYRRIMLQTFPQINRLDGVSRTFLKFNNGKELLKLQKPDLKIELTKEGYWYTNKFPTIDGQTVRLDGDQAFNQSSSQCKQLASNIEMKLKLLESQ